MMEFDLEVEVMGLIVNAGSARSMVMQAMRCAREEEDFAKADKFMDQANEALHGAHEVQTRLIGLDEGSGKIPVHLVMVHAQDHLMNAIMMLEMGREVIALHKKIANKNG
jgi:PTS system cellobiose-specific IIA component